MSRNKLRSSSSAFALHKPFAAQAVPDVRPVVNVFTPVIVHGYECGDPLCLTLLLSPCLFVSVTDLLRAAGYLAGQDSQDWGLPAVSHGSAGSVLIVSW